MKTKTKTSKRIFSLFLAVLCTLGLFFVFHINSFADSFGVIPFGVDSAVRLLAWPNANPFTYVDVYTTSSDHPIYLSACIENGTRYGYALSFYSAPAGTVASTSNNNNYVKNWDALTWQFTGVSDYAGNVYVYGCRSPFSSAVADFYVTVYSDLNSMCTAFFNSFYPVSTPTPSPSPTPAPTPTPTPDPGGSIPTPSGDYGSFFQRMASDAQSAFNALYLSWTNANNRFYSSIFFIGLPLLITVFGIVAGIILGDDD